MARYQKRKRKKVDRDPRLVKSINKKRKYRGTLRSSWMNENSSTVDQVMSLNKALSPWPPHKKSLKKGILEREVLGILAFFDETRKPPSLNCP